MAGVPKGRIQLMLIVNERDDGHGLVMFSQHQSPIPKSWVILDSASTAHSFWNEALVTSIKWSEEKLKLLTNGGPATHNMKTHFFGHEVWSDPTGLANILSLSLITNNFRVTVDSGTENSALRSECRLGIRAFRKWSIILRFKC